MTKRPPINERPRAPQRIRTNRGRVRADALPKNARTSFEAAADAAERELASLITEDNQRNAPNATLVHHRLTKE